MSHCCSEHLPDESATLELGSRLAARGSEHAIVFLQGDLGAGKTTLVRGWLRGLGYQGRVKSPTYTLVEPYEIEDRAVFHFDLYRLADPEELEYLGVDELDRPNTIVLIEWPQRGAGVLPKATLTLQLAHHAQGRELTAIPHTSEAEQWVGRVEAHFG